MWAFLRRDRAEEIFSLDKNFEKLQKHSKYSVTHHRVVRGKRGGPVCEQVKILMVKLHKPYLILLL